jgi:hypothetical protein
MNEFEAWLRGLATQTLTEELKDEIIEQARLMMEDKS